MKMVKIENRNIVPSGTVDGCTVMNGDKQRAAREGCNYITALYFPVYENGKQVHVSPTRGGAIRYCDDNDKPNTVFHIRNAGKLVYYREHGHDPVFFRGFHVAHWRNKSHQRALIDYDNHTPKEVTEQYDAIAYALEQMASRNNETLDKP